LITLQYVATCPKDLHSQKQESTFIYLFKYKSLKKQHFEEGDVVEWLNLCEQKWVNLSERYQRRGEPCVHPWF
jgi:hypothetical protein